MYDALQKNNMISMVGFNSFVYPTLIPILITSFVRKSREKLASSRPPSLRCSFYGVKGEEYYDLRLNAQLLSGEEFLSRKKTG